MPDLANAENIVGKPEQFGGLRPAMQDLVKLRFWRFDEQGEWVGWSIHEGEGVHWLRRVSCDPSCEDEELSAAGAEVQIDEIGVAQLFDELADLMAVPTVFDRDCRGAVTFGIEAQIGHSGARLTWSDPVPRHLGHFAAWFARTTAGFDARLPRQIFGLQVGG